MTRPAITATARSCARLGSLLRRAGRGDRALALRFDAVSGDRFAGVDEERLEGIALILQAIDLTIVAVEARDDGDSREQLATLRYMRQRWREKADEEAER